MNGKRKCKILKEIRKQIAEQNDIEFITSECTHKGTCKGTCPKCEAEVVYLENELRKREALGKRVVVAGLALSLATMSFGCADTLTDDTDSSIDDMQGIAERNPDFTELLSLNEAARNAYISGFAQSELRRAWQNDDAVLGDDLDIFYMSAQYEEFEIRVTYDENGRAKSIDITIISELMGEPVDEFVGDIPPEQ